MADNVIAKDSYQDIALLPMTRIHLQSAVSRKLHVCSAWSCLRVD